MTATLEFAVLGDRVDRSLSPVIHNAALRAAGLVGAYRAIRADRPRLELAVGALRSGRLAGFNVTMPLKRDAFELADALTEEASTAGSVNAMRLAEGLVEGHSTDGPALARFIDRLAGSGDTPILVLGAGATAAIALAVSGDHPVYISARRFAQAAELAKRGVHAEAIVWGSAVAGALVVNTTPLGMSGEVLPQGIVETAMGLLDLPYGARPTPAVDLATAQGTPTVDGVEFLLAQAVDSFRWWTGIEPSLDAMLRAARKV